MEISYHVLATAQHWRQLSESKHRLNSTGIGSSYTEGLLIYLQDFELIVLKFFS
jgi:hypothetical protein